MHTLSIPQRRRLLVVGVATSFALNLIGCVAPRTSTVRNPKGVGEIFYYRYAVDTIPLHRSVSIRTPVWYGGDFTDDPKIKADLRKLREDQKFFLDVFSPTLSSAGLFDEVSRIAHGEDARSDYVLEFYVVGFSGAGIVKPRLLSVMGTVVDVRDESVVLKLFQAASFNRLPGFTKSAS